jgi:hypothetical protein
VRLPGIKFPQPVFTAALEACSVHFVQTCSVLSEDLEREHDLGLGRAQVDSNVEQQALEEALPTLLREDPSLSVVQDVETGDL